MTSSSLRRSRSCLFLFVVGAACTATVACGRVGLDVNGFEIDSGDLDGGLDEGLDSEFVDVSFDTGVRPDGTFLDSGVFIDAGRTDSGVSFDTGRADSGVLVDSGFVDDTGLLSDTFIVPDTRPIDTGVTFDTGIDDTGVTFDSDLDTGTTFDSDLDTGTTFDGGLDTGIGFDSGVGFDTAFDVGIDIGIDGGPVDGGIHCGPTATCNPATEICCAGFGTFACTPPGICVGTPLTCSSAASCKAGDICCFNGGLGGGSATCGPTCTGIQLCALDSECKAGTRCRLVFGGYHICR